MEINFEGVSIVEAWAWAFMWSVLFVCITYYNVQELKHRSKDDKES